MGRSIKNVSSSWNLELIRYQLCLKNLIINKIGVIRNNSMITKIKINWYIYRYFTFVYLLNKTWKSNINLNFISVKMHYYLAFTIMSYIYLITLYYSI